MSARSTEPVPANATGICLECGHYFLPGEDRDVCPESHRQFEPYAERWAREHPEEAAKR